MSSNFQLIALDNEQLRLVDLVSDEKILWTGKPDITELLLTETFGFKAALLIAGILMSGFAFLQVMRELGNVQQIILWLACYGLAFAIIAAVAGVNYQAQRKKAERTIYLITDKRAAILTPKRCDQFKTAQFLDRVPSESGQLVNLVVDRIVHKGQTKLYGFLCLPANDADVAEQLLVEVIKPPVVRKLK